MKRITVLSLLLFILLSALSGCSGESELSVTGDRLVDEKSNVSFVMCSPSLQAVSIGAKVTGYNDTELFEVKGLPTDEFLSESYDSLNYLYRADDIEEPNLADFEPESALICRKGETTVQNAEISDKTVVESIIALLEDGETTIAPAKIDASYEIKFTSLKYPALYYRVSVMRSVSGDVVLNDKGTKRCVDAGKLLDDYLK